MSVAPEDDLHPATARLRLVPVLNALADTGRLAIVRALDAAGESDCTELRTVAGLTISKSTFSHHQKVLREAGLLHVRLHGSRRILSLRRHDLDEVFPGLLDAVLATDPERVLAPPPARAR